MNDNFATPARFRLGLERSPREALRFYGQRLLLLLAIQVAGLTIVSVAYWGAVGLYLLWKAHPLIPILLTACALGWVVILLRRVDARYEEARRRRYYHFAQSSSEPTDVLSGARALAPHWLSLGDPRLPVSHTLHSRPDPYGGVTGSIRFLREMRGMTVERLAMRAGMTVDLLILSEQDISVLSLQHLYAIASALDVGVAELFRGGRDVLLDNLVVAVAMEDQWTITELDAFRTVPFPEPVQESGDREGVRRVMRNWRERKGKQLKSEISA